MGKGRRRTVLSRGVIPKSVRPVFSAGFDPRPPVSGDGCRKPNRKTTHYASHHDRTAWSGRGARAERAEANQAITRLRKEAFAGIEKLIALIDASNEYVQTEREHDDSESEHVGEDLEPSLGSLDFHDEPNTRLVGGVPNWGFIYAELDVSDYEPSLCGVTVQPGDDRDGGADLGSFDRMTDQTVALQITEAAADIASIFDELDPSDYEPDRE